MKILLSLPQKVFYLLFIISIFQFGCNNKFTSVNVNNDIDSVNKIENAINALVNIESNLMYANGVIVSNNGIILTVSHGITTINPRIQLYNGNSYQATILYNNSVLDIAILKIECDTQLPFIELADKNYINQKVILIGRESDYNNVIINSGNILMKGINYEISTDKKYLYQNSILHDGRCELGYSGGPLLSVKGKLLGINGAFFGRPKDNLTLALDIDNYKYLLNQIINKKSIQILEVPKLDNISSKVIWILDGLEKNCLNNGIDLEVLRIYRSYIQGKAIDLNLAGDLSDKNTLKWAWKTFLMGLNDIKNEKIIM